MIGRLVLGTAEAAELLSSWQAHLTKSSSPPQTISCSGLAKMATKLSGWGYYSRD